MLDLSLHQNCLYSQTNNRNFFCDQDLRLLSANEAFLTDIGCAQLEDVLGTRLEELGGQSYEIIKILIEAENKTIEKHQKHSAKNIRCSIQGRDTVVSLEYCPVFTDSGHFHGTACHYSADEYSEALGFEKILIDALMRSTQDAIYFKDVNSRFIRVSHSMIERLGAPDLDSIVGTTDFDYWNFDCAQGFFQDERRIMETREPLIGVCEKEIRTDGKQTWVITSKMALEDEFGNVFGTFGISKDITDLKETEVELKKTNGRLVSASRRAGMAEIASNVIHNVGNVLNSVNVSLSLSQTAVKNCGVENLIKAADLLQNNKDEPNFLSANPKGKVLPDFLRMSAESLVKMQTSVVEELALLERNLNHIKTIVSMQQQYAGIAPVTETVQLTSLVDDAIQIGQCTLIESNVSVGTNFLVDIEAEIDKHRVLQILVNLIRNAKHACEEVDHDRPKQICVTIDQPTPDFFMIEISDNGIGIEQKNLTSIFNHGFTTKENGKGFGLHSSANTAKELGGSLIATSAGKGTGAAFVLNLPTKSTQKDDSDVRSEVHSIGESDMDFTSTPISTPL